MGVLECAIMHPGKTLQIWGLQPIWLSQWEPPRNSVLGAGLKVKISWTLTRFPKSFLDNENLGQNVNLKNPGHPKGGPKILVYVYIAGDGGYPGKMVGGA